MDTGVDGGKEGSSVLQKHPRGFRLTEDRSVPSACHHSAGSVLKIPPCRLEKSLLKKTRSGLTSWAF